MREFDLSRLQLFLEQLLEPRKKNTEQPPEKGLLYHLCARLRGFDSDQHLPVGAISRFTEASLKIYRIVENQTDTMQAWEEISVLSRIVGDVIAKGLPPADTRFPTVKNDKLRNILERDLQEAERAADFGLWKSCLILCGSVLETALYELFRRDPPKTMRRPHVPGKSKWTGGGPKDITSNEENEQWKLCELIKFACENDVLPPEYKDHLDISLRDPRNLVHPTVELRKTSEVSRTQAELGLAAARQVLDLLNSKPFPPPSW